MNNFYWACTVLVSLITVYLVIGWIWEAVIQ